MQPVQRSTILKFALFLLIAVLLYSSVFLLLLNRVSNSISISPCPTGYKGSAGKTTFPFYASARDFGAKGDGLTDDTAALQAGIDCVSRLGVGDRRGGVLLLPAGTYLINHPLILPRSGVAANPVVQLKGEMTSYSANQQIWNTILKGGPAFTATYHRDLYSSPGLQTADPEAYNYRYTAMVEWRFPSSTQMGSAVDDLRSWFQSVSNLRFDLPPINNAVAIHYALKHNVKASDGSPLADSDLKLTAQKLIIELINVNIRTAYGSAPILGSLINLEGQVESSTISNLSLTRQDQGTGDATLLEVSSSLYDKPDQIAGDMSGLGWVSTIENLSATGAAQLFKGRLIRSTFQNARCDYTIALPCFEFLNSAASNLDNLSVTGRGTGTVTREQAYVVFNNVSHFIVNNLRLSSDNRRDGAKLTGVIDSIFSNTVPTPSLTSAPATVLASGRRLVVDGTSTRNRFYNFPLLGTDLAKQSSLSPATTSQNYYKFLLAGGAVVEQGSWPGQPGNPGDLTDPVGVNQLPSTRELPTASSTFCYVSVRTAPYLASGDGLHDDTTAIQKAIQYVSGSGGGSCLGGVVFLPSGRYLLSSPLVLPRSESWQKAVYLVGENIRSSVLRSIPTTSLLSPFPANRALVEWEAAVKPTYSSLKNLTFELSALTEGVMAIHYQPTHKESLAATQAEILHIDLESILVEGNNRDHPTEVYLEGIIDGSTVRNLNGDSSTTTTARYDTAVLKTDTNLFGQPLDSLTSGFNRSSLQNLYGSVRKGGFSEVFDGRLNSSRFRNSFCIGAQHGPCYSFLNSSRSLIATIGDEGRYENPQFKVANSDTLAIYNAGLGTPGDDLRGLPFGHGLELTGVTNSLIVNMVGNLKPPYRTFETDAAGHLLADQPPTFWHKRRVVVNNTSSKNRFFNLALNIRKGDTLFDEVALQAADGSLQPFSNTAIGESSYYQFFDYRNYRPNQLYIFGK